MTVFPPSAVTMSSQRMPLSDGFTVSFVFQDRKLETEWQARAPYVEHRFPIQERYV